MMSKKLIGSIIVPLAASEKVNPMLLTQLGQFTDSWEIIICSYGIQGTFTDSRSITWLKAADGRAECLNAGAKAANGNWLLFLHSDSLLADNAKKIIEQAIIAQKSAVYYFDLKFDEGRFILHSITEFFVKLRCGLLNTPFGDQGFLVKRSVFEQIGGFPNWDMYGEDHLFIRKARRTGIPILSMHTPIYTSARRYRTYGFFKTTFKFQKMWLSQIIRDIRRQKSLNITGDLFKLKRNIFKTKDCKL